MGLATNKSYSGEGDIPRWIDRVGAALVDPIGAMRASDTPAGQGRAASDVALLLLLTVLAVETHLFVSAAWMLRDGEWSGALTVLLVGARGLFAMPIVVLLVGGVAVTLSAGRKRRPADDFDLSCVALTPLIALELVNALVSRFALDLHTAISYVGYTWFCVLLVLAYRQARSRVKVQDDRA